MSCQGRSVVGFLDVFFFCRALPLSMQVRELTGENPRCESEWN